MEELRKRRVDCCDVRSGRKAWMVVKGARRCAFRVSDQEEGERDDIRLVVWLEEGMRTSAVR